MGQAYLILNMQRNIVKAPKFGFYATVGVVMLLLTLFANYMEEKAVIRQNLLNNLWVMPYLVLLNYWFYDKIMPRLSYRRPLPTLFYLGIVFGLASFGAFVWRHLGTAIQVFTIVDTYDDLADEVCTYFQRCVAAMLFFGFVRHFYGHFRLREAAQQLRIEKQEAELSFLKSQTNPHFLFNTLNNIYSLARDKSDQTPESILRLSELLRFMLYETSGAQIAIEQEVKIIQDYIALEKLRYDDRLQVDFQYEITDMKLPIPPLLMMPLVENAFKHGASEQKNAKPVVKIFLQATAKQLLLTVRNTLGTPTENDPNNGQTMGIGLSNIRRQLELQFGEYALDTRQEDPFFIATLNVNLDSHV
jgi:two-component system, LytTR family, sensor kinase